MSWLVGMSVRSPLKHTKTEIQIVSHVYYETIILNSAMYYFLYLLQTAACSEVK